jgi:hypothetical protein
LGLQIAGRVGHDGGMAKTPKRPRDPNQLAKMMIDIGAGEFQSAADSELSPMAALGRAGGQKGGRARAQSLSDQRRSEIAKLGALARWKANGGDKSDQ